MGPAAGAVIEIISDDDKKEDPFSAKPTADDIKWVDSLLLDKPTGFGQGLDDSAAADDDDDEKEDPFSAKPTAGDFEWVDSLLLDEPTGFGDGLDDSAAADDDDDCVILDGDPDKPLVAVKEEKPGRDGAEEELQVVSEKGEVACRDFPHPRHLCARWPFGTGSHANHCTMCHCYVCDSRAPCPRWGKGTLPTDHCHATDKDKKWKKQRQSLKRKSMPPSKREGVKKMSLSSSTTPSSQQLTGHQVSVAQPVSTATQVVPEVILERKMVKKHNKAQVQVLVKWSGPSEEVATWEDYEVLKNRFPDAPA